MFDAMHLRTHIEDELAEARQRVWGIPLLQGELPLDDYAAALVARELGSYSSVFPRCLGALVASTDDDVVRSALVDNLWQEHGCGNLLNSHRGLYERFVRSIEAHLHEKLVLAPISSSTLSARRSLLRLCRSGFLVGLGGLAIGIEADTAAQFGAINRIFQGLPYGSELDLEFFQVHEASDESDANALLEVLADCIHSDAEYVEAATGALQAVWVDFCFWKNLNDLIQVAHSG